MGSRGGEGLIAGLRIPKRRDARVGEKNRTSLPREEIKAGHIKGTGNKNSIDDSTAT